MTPRSPVCNALGCLHSPVVASRRLVLTSCRRHPTHILTGWFCSQGAVAKVSAAKGPVRLYEKSLLYPSAEFTKDDLADDLVLNISGEDTPRPGVDRKHLELHDKMFGAAEASEHRFRRRRDAIEKSQREGSLKIVERAHGILRDAQYATPPLATTLPRPAHPPPPSLHVAAFTRAHTRAHSDSTLSTYFRTDTKHGAISGKSKSAMRSNTSGPSKRGRWPGRSGRLRLRPRLSRSRRARTVDGRLIPLWPRSWAAKLSRQ